jgi:serine/threonine protein kinase
MNRIFPTGEGPFGAGSTAALVYRVVHSTPSFDRLPTEMRPLIERCLTKDPSDRPTAGDLLAELGAVQLARDWPPQAIIRELTQDTLPDPASAEPVGADGTPARVATEGAGSSDPVSSAPQTITAGKLPLSPESSSSQPHPSRSGQDGHPNGRRSLAWVWLIGGLLAASAAAVFAVTTLSRGSPLAHSQPSAGATPTTPREVSASHTQAANIYCSGDVCAQLQSISGGTATIKTWAFDENFYGHFEMITPEGQVYNSSPNQVWLKGGLGYYFHVPNEANNFTAVAWRNDYGSHYTLTGQVSFRD